MSDVIPVELYGEILKLVPVQHLISLRSVCKEWRSMIDVLVLPPSLFIQNVIPYEFRRRKRKLYSLPLHSLDHSFSSDRTKISLTNILDVDCPGVAPTCHSYVPSIPPYNPFHPDEPKFKSLCDVFHARGYDASTSDYKVVRVTRKRGNSNFRTSMYSLKSQTWRRIEDFPHDICPTQHDHYEGLFMQGALHWVANWFALAYCIGVLDLSTESYRRLPLPSSISSTFDREQFGLMCVMGVNLKLDVLGGHLFLSCNKYDFKSVWILKDYGGQNKWAQLALFNRPEEQHIDVKNEWCSAQMRPVVYLKSKDQVIIHYDRDKLMWLDVEKEEFVKKVTIKGFDEHGFSCQQMPARFAWPSGTCSAADESVTLNKRKTTSKRKRATVEFEISVFKRPKS